MALRLRNKLPPTIPTSSMADIAFLLIIFFMLTAVYSTNRGLEYGLPKNEDPLNVQPLESMHIHIVAPGQYTIDRRALPLSQIAYYVDDKLKQNPKKPVIVQTEPEVPYYVTVEVLDLLKELKVENISIPTASEVAMWGGFTGGVSR